MQKEADMKRDTLIDVMPQWYEFSRCDQDLVQWFESMENQLESKDIQDIEVSDVHCCSCVYLVVAVVTAITDMVFYIDAKWSSGCLCVCVCV